MTHPPRITDEFVLTRWMAMEIGKINEGLVRDRKSLAALLLENTPCSVTKKGDQYLFDRSIIYPPWTEAPRRPARPPTAPDPVLYVSGCD